MDLEADEVRLVLHHKADTLQKLEQESSVWRELENDLKRLRDTRADLLDRTRDVSRKEEDLRKLIEVLDGRIVKDPQRLMYFQLNAVKKAADWQQSDCRSRKRTTDSAKRSSAPSRPS